jgi:hypothetical protein
MKKQNPVDDLFRQGLSGYKVTPSEEHRSTVIRDALKGSGESSSKRWWFVGVGAGLMILAGIGLFILEERPGLEKSALPMEVRTERPGAKEANDIKAIQPVQRIHPAHNINLIKKIQEVNEKPLISTEPLANSDANSEIRKELASSQPSVTSDNNGSLILKLESVDQPKPAVSNQKEVEINADKINKENNQTVKLDTRKEEKTPDNKKQHHLPENWNLSAGVSYTPEWMFNTLNGDKFVNNMAVEGTFHFGPYSVRTGLGLSITTGSNELLVKTSPYLGTYNKLDSVGFRWDVKHYYLIPTLYTSKTNVYDTALRYNYSNIQKRYTYLQVPVILGYDFWQNNWLSLGIRAGAIMSVLLKVETLTTAYDPGKDKVISINDISPDRINLNWQAVGGFNIGFKLSRSLNIDLEPGMRYYFNSVYESSEINKKPWSVGLRTAFFVTF